MKRGRKGNAKMKALATLLFVLTAGSDIGGLRRDPADVHPAQTMEEPR